MLSHLASSAPDEAPADGDEEAGAPKPAPAPAQPPEEPGAAAALAFPLQDSVIVDLAALPQARPCIAYIQT